MAGGYSQFKAPAAPVRYDQTDQDRLRRMIEQTFAQFSNVDSFGSLTLDELVVGSDPGSLVGTPIVRVGGDLAVAGASNPALRLWNTGTNGRRYALYSGNSPGFFEIFDDTASAARLTVDATGIVSVLGTLKVGSGTGSPTSLSFGGRTACNNISPTTVAVCGVSGLVMLRDSTNGGSVVLHVDVNEGTAAIIRSTTTPSQFVGGAPGATQIQVTYSNPNVRVQGGSSRTSFNIDSMVLQASS